MYLKTITRYHVIRYHVRGIDPKKRIISKGSSVYDTVASESFTSYDTSRADVCFYEYTYDVLHEIHDIT